MRLWRTTLPKEAKALTQACYDAAIQRRELRVCKRCEQQNQPWKTLQRKVTVDLPRIRPPWDEQTVRHLNHYQTGGTFHPFTCENRPHFGNREAVLIATSTGWICPECDYTQDWAHAFMADPEITSRFLHYRGGA